ncbi:hypothetical protein [Desulforhabdus amnigena]|jgi:hypothetical protein|uniref:Uncharacterized protein n=1 Tax=Desulforhabdus amnigena TaxID=40218 RepID=A0A9W6FWI5_9BACT|nr:hypothetical protein [Desulforhabdus amnigena]NLJ29883.1 hypothetical protein [Deltaproteobacteria bacterium]GLI36244.1 hypothetical protein DAMNIGENAA_36770 [Desulforhabdus amnigena]
MRYFPVLDFQNVVLAICIGLTTLIVLYISFRNYDRPSAGGDQEKPLEEYPSGIRAGHHPIPPVVALVLVGVIFFAVYYVIFIGIKGPTF